MKRYNVKPSKPAGMFGTVVGIAILVVGFTTMHKFNAFMVVWGLVGIGIIVFNLWAAFSPRGSSYSIQARDDVRPGSRPGTTTSDMSR